MSPAMKAHSWVASPPVACPPLPSPPTSLSISLAHRGGPGGWAGAFRAVWDAEPQPAENLLTKGRASGLSEPSEMGCLRHMK